MEVNFLNKMINATVDSFLKLKPGDDDFWPPGWNKKEKLAFLDDTIMWLNKYEYYEQSSILLDVKKKIESV